MLTEFTVPSVFIVLIVLAVFILFTVFPTTEREGASGDAREEN